MPASIRPAMSDGRALTNYLSTCEFENSLKQNFNISNESQYRLFLQHKARDVGKRSKQYPEFNAYWSTSTCPKAADAHESMVNKLSKR